MSAGNGYYEFYQGSWLYHAPTGGTRYASADEAARLSAAAGGRSVVNPGEIQHDTLALPPVPNPALGQGNNPAPGTSGGVPLMGTPPVPGPTQGNNPTYDPPGGGPSFTPGIVFGKGQIPGQGDSYQRQWFDVGPSSDKEALNVSYYDDPSNFKFAWDKVVNQFGGQVGGGFNKFLQGFGSNAQADFQNAVPYDPNLHVANFLDQYAPQVKGVYDLMSSSAKGWNGAGSIAGRANY